MKDEVYKVEQLLNDQNLISLEDAKERILPRHCGFYWIYTKLKLDDFLNASEPKPNTRHINIPQLSNVHKGLKHINVQNEDDYWCIYNGKAKKLKDRIVAQFTLTGEKIGKLALNQYFNSTDFKIKYIVCVTDDIENGIKIPYEELEKDFERSWRLNNKWPMLCCG